MIKIDLAKNNRKYIEIEIEGRGKLKYYERSTAQIKEMKKLFVEKSESELYREIDSLNESHFIDNIQGDEAIKSDLLKSLETDGNLFRFLQECDEALGKHIKSESNAS